MSVEIAQTSSKATAGLPDHARHAAYDALYLVDQRRRRRTLKLNVLMEQIQTEYAERYGPGWGGQEQRLFHALCTGVVRHWWQLEKLMIHFLQRELRLVTPHVRTLLRLGLFQLLHLSEIPEYAAVHATVQVGQHRKLSKKTIGLINGVLRNAGRQKETGDLPFPASPDDDAYSYATSVGALPNWLARRLLDYYTPQHVAALCKAQLTPVPVALRVNTLKATLNDVVAALQSANVSCHSISHMVPELPEILILDDFVGGPAQLPGFAEGHFYVQDVSSARVAPFLAPQPGQTVIDLCAAPGSKTTHMAALMQNTGQIIAVDNKPNRLADIHTNLERLGITNVHTVEADSRTVTLDQLGLSEAADAVLVDAPCSGLGTIRKHPEILLNLREQDMAEFPPKQLALLHNAWTLLKPGGTLVYSTCSIDPTENEHVVQTFLDQTPTAQLLAQHTYLTHAEPDADQAVHWDGFYMAKFTKQG